MSKIMYEVQQKKKGAEDIAFDEKLEELRVEVSKRDIQRKFEAL